MTDLQRKQKIDETIRKSQTLLQNNNNKSKWDLIIEGIVRPPKNIYSIQNLGSPVFQMNDNIYYRQDYKIPHGDLNKNIDLTLYTQNNPQKYVILYLHGNTSNRLESISLLKYAPNDYAVACFDFFGCGNNDSEETITLGYNQSRQAKTVADFLRSLKYKIILWGRSMGAVTALLYGEADIIVSDSAFSTFKGMCKDFVKVYSPKIVPNCCISCMFPCVFKKLRSDIKKRAKYNVQKLNVLKAVKDIDQNCVIIFMAGDKDQIISINNSQMLYQQFPGKKKHIEIFKGSHNVSRPKEVMNKVIKIIQSYTSLQQQKMADHIKPKSQLSFDLQLFNPLA